MQLSHFFTATKTCPSYYPHLIEGNPISWGFLKHTRDSYFAVPVVKNKDCTCLSRSINFENWPCNRQWERNISALRIFTSNRGRRFQLTFIKKTGVPDRPAVSASLPFLDSGLWLQDPRRL